MKPQQTNRCRAYYRHHRRRIIHKKAKIAVPIGWNASCKGQYAKGKIHCSCSLCAVKTQKDGFPHS